MGTERLRSPEEAIDQAIQNKNWAKNIGRASALVTGVLVGKAILGRDVPIELVISASVHSIASAANSRQRMSEFIETERAVRHKKRDSRDH